MEKVLVANRGEIAVRVLRACRELGLVAVAVYSDADRDALHVEVADEAWHIGETTPAKSYLNVDALVEVARRARADAVHPGYGFLAENAAFAQAVMDAGLRWVGPKPAAIAAMGDKVSARRVAEQAKAPLVPGTAEPLAGPGGAGLRRPPRLPPGPQGGLRRRRRHEGGPLGRRRGPPGWSRPGASPRPPSAATRSTPSATWTPPATSRPRSWPTGAARWCSWASGTARSSAATRSWSRRPAPGLPEEVRVALGKAACDIARAADYENAGTIEFLYEPATHKFYFLEMNTRLQVEHPVTELTAGIDLVHAQLRVAAGEGIPAAYDGVVARGHAIEARINAEDPGARFMPAPGPITGWREPSGPGSGSTPACGPASPSPRPTTRCWPS